MNGAYEGEKGGRECESKIWCEQATHRFKGLLHWQIQLGDRVFTECPLPPETLPLVLIP